MLIAFITYMYVTPTWPKREILAFDNVDCCYPVQEEQTIAARTRSKLSLEDTSIIDLESTFVPPDFTPDMYDTQCEDEDWQGFLQSLYKPPGFMPRLPVFNILTMLIA